MTKAQASVIVDRPVENVWKFVTTDGIFKANPEVTGWKQTSPGPFGVGTTFRETRDATPKTMDFRVTEFVPNQRLTAEITSGPIKGTVATESLESAEGKTRLTETAEYHFSGIYKLLEPFIARPGQLRKETQERVERMKRLAEEKF
jgi:uncharacterized protein YndB with AHSA1/START domain